MKIDGFSWFQHGLVENQLKTKPHDLLHCKRKGLTMWQLPTSHLDIYIWRCLHNIGSNWSIALKTRPRPDLFATCG